MPRKKASILFDYKGKKQNLVEIAKDVGVSYATLYHRYVRGAGTLEAILKGVSAQVGLKRMKDLDDYDWGFEEGSEPALESGDWPDDIK